MRYPTIRRAALTVCTALTLLMTPSCARSNRDSAVLDGPGIRLEFDSATRSRVIRKLAGKTVEASDWSSSECLESTHDSVPDMALTGTREDTLQDTLGSGKRLVVLGRNALLEKQVTVDIYEDFPSMALMKVSYRNLTAEPLQIKGWTSHHYEIPVAQPKVGEPPLWSFHGASYEDRRDWILPVSEGFAQDNFLGMSASDYGGGTPIAGVWGRESGIAVGHTETAPRLVSLPVSMPLPDRAEISVTSRQPRSLEPGATLTTLRTFVMVHRGDFFSVLATYRRLMARQGIVFDEFPDSAYEPVWCAWGYERDFTMQQVYGTLSKVRALGFEWAVLDDGWQTSEGDWYLNKKKYPRGDSDMRRFTDRIRAAGLRPKLWWAPLSVDPGTELIREHSDLLLVNEAGKYQEISWWDAYYLCPAYGPTRAYTRDLVRRMMNEWGYDGLKIDGQHLNGVPPCYNKVHQHAQPEDAVEALPAFFKDIYTTALAIRSDAVVEICPCGTSFSFFNMPFTNQPVSSDPLNSWQIRLKGKAFKALMGSQVPYYGDHVELSDGGDDFASAIGIGGVPGTKFTWPAGAKKDSKIELTPAREKKWARWIQIYKEKMLAKGDYLGELYDIGFDRPETHAISKDGTMYYAFFADAWDGDLELRGLSAGAFRVHDYVNGTDLGKVIGPIGKFRAVFHGHLLVECQPVLNQPTK